MQLTIRSNSHRLSAFQVLVVRKPSEVEVEAEAETDLVAEGLGGL